MIEPTVGRVVWYRPNGLQIGSYHSNQPLAAIIAYVHSSTCVNLAVFDSNGSPHSRTSVRLIQEWETPPDYGWGYCEWMPYQKAVARGEIFPVLHAT